MGEAHLEVFIVFLVWPTPLHFTEGIETRKEHIERVLGVGHILRPQVCLSAKNVMLLLFWDSFERFEAINLADRKVVTNSWRLTIVILQLIVVNVAVIRGGA